MLQKIDWTGAETAEDVKRLLEEFWVRNGIVIKEPDYWVCCWSEENIRKYADEVRRRSPKPT